MRRFSFFLTLLLLIVPVAGAQDAQDLSSHRVIEFPDVPGYHTLVCDLHTHTVFSDGSVWPDIRVEEAVRDGLDCLAITDHIEYQPHIEDIPHPDRNRSYEEAVRVLKNMMEDEEEEENEEADEEEEKNDESLLLLRGAEITRSMPPGHINAVLLEDVNPVQVDDAKDALREANRQGAFMFWNHPWSPQKPDGIAELTDMHHQLIDEGLLHGIEVVNKLWYSDEALQIALDNNLAIIGTSDVHGLVDWDYDVPGGGHRPVTLVFATDRSLDALGEAFRMRRTAVWYKDVLIGRPEHVQPLIEASLSVKTAEYGEDTSVLHVAIKNISDAAFTLRNRSEKYTFADATDLIVLDPHSVTSLEVKTGERGFRHDLVFEVLNVVTAPATHPEWTLTIEVEEMREGEQEESE